MKSVVTQRFWDDYRRLPKRVREQARQAYRQWQRHPDLPGLRFKLVNARLHIYSVRIDDNYRVLGELTGDTMSWFFIGSHQDYEREIKRGR
jgi:mRNA-degrading endonuclease RelE of RelBE toxin-antitoxin system